MHVVPLKNDHTKGHLTLLCHSKFTNKGMLPGRNEAWNQIVQGSLEGEINEKPGKNTLLSAKNTLLPQEHGNTSARINALLPNLKIEH